MLLYQVSRLFREEHRKLRDILLNLRYAFESRDQIRVVSLTADLLVTAGPHFRYEEEAVLPALSEAFGNSFTERLVRDHDTVIETVRELLKLGAQKTFTDRDIGEATRLTDEVLYEVVQCDGLSLMIERLEEPALRAILSARDRCRRESLDLLQWASTLRKPAADR